MCTGYPLAMEPLDVTPVAADRVPLVAGVIARAFAKEPLLHWPLGEVDDPQAVIEEEFAFIAATAAQHDSLWEVGDALGGAIWVRPECADAYWDELLAFSGGIAGAAADAGRRQQLQWDWVVARYPQEPVWVLDSIGVDPGCRGTGIGALLVEHGLALAREAGQPAFLETSRPYLVPYYSRFGFHVVDRDDVPEGGPHIWFMRWDPS